MHRLHFSARGEGCAGLFVKTTAACIGNGPARNERGLGGGSGYDGLEDVDTAGPLSRFGEESIRRSGRLLPLVYITGN